MEKTKHRKTKHRKETLKKDRNNIEKVQKHRKFYFHPFYDNNTFTYIRNFEVANS